MKIHQEVSVTAPAQVANIFGYFDCAGFLCKAPPQNESDVGGVGDVITVQFADGEPSSIAVEYLLRTCDEQGYWGEIAEFSSLMNDVKAHPELDIITHLTRKTLSLIAEREPELAHLTTQPIRISVVKCLPAGRVGVGLGSSASSTAVVVAIDRLFGDVIRRLEDEERKRTGKDANLRLDLMADGEWLVSGARFYDNVAPLLRGGLVFISDRDAAITIDDLEWPRDLHLVTVTPNLSLETRVMREIVRGKVVNIFDVSSETRRRTEVMIGLMQKDVERIIRLSNRSIIEDVRWPLIGGHDKLRKHVEDRRAAGLNISLGISGSGPTIYCLADSEMVANQLGEELHLVWKSLNIDSWWFVQEFNPGGINVFRSK
jgi:homoserine kinase